MKKLIAALLLVTACHSAPSHPSSGPAPVLMPGQTGAADAANAVRGFLTAAKQQDLQAMGAYFGDQDGVARDRIPRDELEKREIFMAMCLRNDRYDIIGDAPGMQGARMLAVNLVRGSESRSVNFEAVPASDHRWYVRSFEVEKLADTGFCGTKRRAP